MHLLDPMVLSETIKQRPDPRVIDWYRGVPSADAFISVLSIGEIEGGIARAQRRSNPFAQRLVAWLDRILTACRDRILIADCPVEPGPVAAEAGALVVSSAARNCSA
jgi:toxin FitB